MMSRIIFKAQHIAADIDRQRQRYSPGLLLTGYRSMSAACARAAASVDAVVRVGSSQTCL